MDLDGDFNGGHSRDRSDRSNNDSWEHHLSHSPSLNPSDKTTSGPGNMEIKSSTLNQTSVRETDLREATLKKHTRYRTDIYSASEARTDLDILSTDNSRVAPTRDTMPRMPKAAARRRRESASVSELPSTLDYDRDRLDDCRETAESYRKRMEALKKDMGGRWLVAMGT